MPRHTAVCHRRCLQHCVFYRPGHLERPRDFRVRVGEYFEDLAKPHPRSVRGVKRILPHPQYDPKTMENDVCLLILDAPVTAIQPVKLVGSVRECPLWPRACGRELAARK